MCVLIFFKTFVWNMSILRRTVWDMIKNVYSSSCKMSITLSYFIETWIFSQILEKYSITKFHENPSSGSRDISWGRTEGQTDTTKLTVAFRNFVKSA